ncbi:MAG: PDZ domain-containing protein [Acidobacteriota bacterium]
MLKASNLFALLVVFVLGGVAIKAQTPAPKIEKDVQVIVNGGDGGYLGVQTQEITKENFSKFGLREVRGVAVEKVMDDSPAKQAGLQDGDVIVKFNGEEITSFRKLTRLISETAPDHQAKLTVLRGGSEREVTVTMGKRQMPQFEMGNFTMATPSFPRMPQGGVFERMPAQGGIRVEGMPLGATGDVFVFGSDDGAGNFTFGSTRQIGVGISSLTKQLGDYFGVAEGKGVLINNVGENSPAAKAGLKAGDVIVEVEGKAISNTMELLRGIAEKKEGEVSLTILRNRNRQTVKVTPEKMKEGEFKIRQPSEGALRVAPNVRINTGEMPRVPATAPVRVRTTNRIL